MAKKTKQEKIKLSQEEAMVIEAQIKKFAVLLDNSNIPDDIKRSLISIMPDLALEQIDKLSMILETRFLDEETKDIDEKFKKELNDLVDEFEKEEKDLDSKFLKNISDFKKSIDL